MKHHSTSIFSGRVKSGFKLRRSGSDASQGDGRRGKQLVEVSDLYNSAASAVLHKRVGSSRNRFET
jgi:hypothetical protein